MSNQNSSDTQPTIEEWVSQVENLGGFADLMSLTTIKDKCPDKDHPKFHWLDGFTAGIEREMIISEDKEMMAINDSISEQAA